MHHRTPAPSSAPARALLPALLAALALVLGTLVLAPAASAAPVEGYARYDGADECKPKAKRGTTFALTWTVKHYGGVAGGISRDCKRDKDVYSEHQEGRAYDWMVDARTTSGARKAKRFIRALTKKDPRGNADALARRMGIMYFIWDDHIYSASGGFEPRWYQNSACPERKKAYLKKCSATLRHRDHVHVSLSWKAARGNTSFYVKRIGSLADARAKKG
ncbi:hypothetical protein [Nocardioides bruguierae]|uniref:ARB-07466-like C-terminal domain-containing protein n=1 Tax=Nocardioides bruguierae TaxID=2945102 RepID=A0A9X2DA16_9ACTN|nr:hypothetical protein [Nocardioides bruguierae]MCM0620774.1 hypothetical protein [Nocardioides bruguierae]